MRIRTYLRVVSDEATIRALGDGAKVAGASVREPNATAAVGDGQWWSWETDIVDLDLNDEDRGVRALLTRCQSLLPHIKNRLESEIDVILEVVTYYQPTEGSPGLYLSAESISLLNELGGSLDHDIVPDL